MTELVQQERAHSRSREQKLIALTIHQAKNREFDRVIVLWPYEVRGSDERKRRLAYNAITRAKKEAFVVIQGQPSPPWMPGTARAAKNTQALTVP